MTTATPPTNPGFFGQVLVQTPFQVAKSAKKTVLVDVGGQGDCGFRAVAAGLVDNFVTNPRMRGDLLNKVLPQHFNYFPQHRPTVVGLTTPAERMQQLINQVRMPELIQSLAYTLRQIAVDELCAHPANYRGAFANQHEYTSPEQMRKASTWIDESAIAALAQALDVPIEVKVVSRGKELPLRLQYNEASRNAQLVVQLQNGHYIAHVTHGELFMTVKQRPLTNVKVFADDAKHDSSLEDILAVIAEEDKYLLHEFESTHNRLTAMVVAGELSKQDLLVIYIKGMTSSDYLHGRVKYVGTEHGHQHFFAALLQAQKGTEVVELPTATYEDQVVNELVRGIARAVSIGQMSMVDVFAAIDNKEESRSQRILA